jgi:hypothetical protein
MKLKSPSRAPVIPDASTAPLKARNAETRAVVAVLKKAFPGATVDAYCYAGWSIRLRVIDPAFGRIKPFDRIDKVSDALEALPSATQQKIVRVVPITPAEHRSKVWSHDYEFDHPLPFGA